MPVEPNTGMQLPYKGEPGYEEAKAQFPELYAQEEQQMAQGGEMQAEMPGDEGPRDMGAAQDMGGQQEMAAQDELMQMAQAAPVPDKPYSVAAVKTMVKELNKTLDTFAGQDMPDIEVEISGSKLDGPLPPEVFLTLMAISESLKMMGGEFADKYSLNPEELMSDADLRKATAMLKKMAKDKKLVEAMQAPVGGTQEMAPEQPSAPGFFNEDEQTLAANMG